MPENVSYDHEIKEEVEFGEKYHAQVLSFVDLERYFTKNGNHHDYDTSCIELTLGDKWGDHGTVYIDNHEELRKFGELLIEIADRTRDSHIEGANQMPDDFAPEVRGLQI